MDKENNIPLANNATGTCESDLQIISDLNGYLVSSKQDIERENSKLKEEKSNLQDQLDNANERISSLVEGNDDLNNQLNDANERISSLVEGNDDLNNQLNDANERISSLVEGNDDLNNQLNDANERISSLVEGNDDLNNQLNDANERISSLVDQLNEISNADTNDFNKKLHFFSLGKSFWDTQTKKFFIELGEEIKSASGIKRFEANGETYNAISFESNSKTYTIRKNEIIIQITKEPKDPDIRIVSLNEKLYFELSNIEKLEDLEVFKFFINKNSDGADKLIDALRVIKKYTSAINRIL